MPREKGFMGLGDNRSDDEAFREGKRESRKSGLGDDLGRKMNQTRERFTESILDRDPRSSQEKAYDAGWEKGKKDRLYYEKPKPGKKKSKTNYSSGGGGGSIDYGYGDSEGGLAAGLIVLAILGIGIVLCAANLTKIEQWVSSGSPTQKNPVTNQQQNSFSAPIKKEVNCAEIIKKRKSGKKVKLPSECKDFNQSTQQINQTELQANKSDFQTPPVANHQTTEAQNQQRAKAEQQAQIEQQRIESERQEQIRQQQESDERARDFVRRREEERRQVETERINEEQAERRRQQVREEYARQQKENERRQQEKNERIIRQGIGIRNKIFKKH